jgi:sirohydrochlorin ferrochelatase
MRGLLASLSISAVLLACTPANQQPAPNIHAQHVVHTADVEPDELGRQLHDMQHEMSPEMVSELRGRPVFSGYSDEQIVKVMGMMGPNYTWPVSDDGIQGENGALILVHGFGEHGDSVLRAQLGPTAGQQPTALAIGMSMMTSAHIQLAIQDLENAGARNIVVIPVVSTRHNSLMRQWNYIFDQADQPAYGSVPKVQSSARITLAEPLDAHPLVGEILVDYAAEASMDPSNEEVIIVGHGPVDAADNLEQLMLMESLANYIREDANFAAVHVATLQDDAPPEVRRQRIQELRALVSEANLQGRQAIIVTNLLGTRIVQSSLRRALRGLNYRFNTKGLIQHENFIEWINISIDDTVAAASN